MDRYIKPAVTIPGRAWDYFAAIDGQDDDLEHEDAMLDGRPCRCEACTRPEPIDGAGDSSWCARCGSTKWPFNTPQGIFGLCAKHYREFRVRRAAKLRNGSLVMEE